MLSDVLDDALPQLPLSAPDEPAEEGHQRRQVGTVRGELNAGERRVVAGARGLW